VRVLVVGDSPEVLCVGGLLASDSNDVVFAPVEKPLNSGFNLKAAGVEHCFDALNLYKDSATAGLFDLVLFGESGDTLELQRNIIRPALAHDAVVIPLPSSEQCDEILCHIVGELFVVRSNAEISVSIDEKGNYILSDSPRMRLEEREESDSWRLDFISTALTSAGIDTSVA